MRTLRRILPAFAALLAVLVAVQATDLVACADEAVTAEHGGQTHTDASVTAGHPVPAAGSTHDDSGGDHETPPDCLCHVVFTPLAVVPEVGVRPAPESVDFGVYVVGWTDAAAQGIDPVPLA